MRKLAFVLFALFLLGSCSYPVSNSDSEPDIVLPGKDRIWWFNVFQTEGEAVDFLAELKSARMNGDFRFGFFPIDSLNPYEKDSLIFCGHIDINTSKKTGHI